MDRYETYRIDGSSVGRCSVCMANIPIDYQHNEGDMISCYVCETKYTLLSKRPVKLVAMKERYSDSFIREPRYPG